jgi:hypothetical protein
VEARSVVTPHASGGARLGVERWLAPSLALRAHLEGERAVTETTLRVDDMAVWSSPRVEVRVGLSLLARIP